MKRVLDGIRVLDFGRFIAAPYCGMMLADMGAEVIRVERPGGEEDRTVGLTGPNGQNMSYPSYARNKKGITLNLTKKDDERSRKVLADLVKTTDVVLYNFSPKAAQFMGLTYEELAAIKPDIIVSAVSCFGSSGPYANRVGFDYMAQAMSGAMDLGGFAEIPPQRAQVPFVDFSTALNSTIGILLALRHRDQTGEGQMVDVALLQTATSFTAPQIAEVEVLGRLRPRVGNRAVYMGPSDLDKCKDGYVFIATIMDTLFKRLTRAIGREDLVDDPDLQTDLQRFENRHKVESVLRLQKQPSLSGQTATTTFAGRSSRFPIRYPCSSTWTTVLSSALVPFRRTVATASCHSGSKACPLASNRSTPSFCSICVAARWVSSTPWRRPLASPAKDASARSKSSSSGKKLPSSRPRSVWISSWASRRWRLR